MEKILKLECVNTENCSNPNFLDPNFYPHDGFFLTKDNNGSDVITIVAYKNGPSCAVCTYLTMPEGLRREDYFKDAEEKNPSEKKRIIHDNEWVSSKTLIEVLKQINSIKNK